MTKKKEYKFFHVNTNEYNTDIEINRKITIAYYYENNNCYYNYTICNPKEQFVKKLGRQYSLNKLKEVKYELTPITSNKNLHLWGTKFGVTTKILLTIPLHSYDVGTLRNVMIKDILKNNPYLKNKI